MTEIGMGIAISACWIIITLISLYPTYGPWIIQENNNLIYQDPEWKLDFSILFFIFWGFWILGFFLISLFVKETKDMTPFEIIKQYWDQDYNALTEE